jgi:CcmD family protein
MSLLLALETGAKYVAGAYLVFFTLVLIYVAIMGSKITRIEREVSDLLELTKEKNK